MSSGCRDLTPLSLDASSLPVLPPPSLWAGLCHLTLEHLVPSLTLQWLPLEPHRMIACLLAHGSVLQSQGRYSDSWVLFFLFLL